MDAILDVFGEHINPCMKDLMLAKEQNISAVLNELMPGWTPAAVKGALEFIKFQNDPLQRETLHLNGKPIMEFYPLETSQHDEGDKVVFRVTQKWRRL